MNDTASRQPPPDLIKTLERSKAQSAAGETLPLEPFLQELRDSIARMSPSHIMS